jgi:hypothetical protein
MFAGAAHAQQREARPADVQKMEAAVPTEAAVKPEKARKVLVFGRTGPKTATQGAGFVHSSIPLGCAAVKAMGEKTGAYSAEISYDPSLFDDMNKLEQFDAVVLVSTTHDFLADPKDEAISKKRIDNLVNFVKGGKGVAGFHAAGDAYYDEPEYGELIGAYFSRHDGGREQIQVVNEDPKSPITAAFGGEGFVYHDEIYRFLKQTAAKGGQVFSRSHVHVLLSVDVTKNHNEQPGTDMPVSWIHEEGKGRVFYNSLGHNEYVWWDKTILKYDLAGIQYAIGDLKADATPAGESKTASAK